MEIYTWLSSMRASDVMVREVTTLKPSDTVAEAARIFLHEQISGAPVVDEGRCLGVFSVTGILAAEQKASQGHSTAGPSDSATIANVGLGLPASIYEAKLRKLCDAATPATDQPVARFMTADIVSVAADTPLRTVVQYMVDAHVHRLVVLDDQSRLQGLISTTDVLAALLRST